MSNEPLCQFPGCVSPDRRYGVPHVCGLSGFDAHGGDIDRYHHAFLPPAEPKKVRLALPKLYPHDTCTTGCLLCRLEVVESAALSAIDQLSDPYGDQPERHWREALKTLRHHVLGDDKPTEETGEIPMPERISFGDLWKKLVRVERRVGSIEEKLK